MRAQIDSLLTGDLSPLGPQGKPSGIAKTPVDEPLHVGLTGLEGDRQADLENHGGVDKAIHHYAREHYAYWRRQLAHQPPVLDAPGAFGENVSTVGMDEDTVCVGDVFEMGTALVQVSQARQPCWKLNARFAHEPMAMAVRSTRKSGWYYRVLREGLCGPGDEIRLVRRPHEEWPLTRLMAIVYDKSQDTSELAEMADLELLAPNWRDLARKRLDTLSRRKRSV